MIGLYEDNWLNLIFAQVSPDSPRAAAAAVADAAAVTDGVGILKCLIMKRGIFTMQCLSKCMHV